MREKALPKKVTQSLVDHWVMLCRSHDLGEPSLAYTVRQEEGGVSILAIELPMDVVVPTVTQQPRQDEDDNWSGDVKRGMWRERGRKRDE